MGHSISGFVVRGDFDRAIAEKYDLIPAIERAGLFPVDHYFTAYWQARGKNATATAPGARLPSIFPDVGPILALVREITALEAPLFGILPTDYLGGAGGQWAVLYEAGQWRDLGSFRINAVLAALGLTRDTGCDEFDTLGLGGRRSNPDYLDRYVGLCEERGV